MASRPAPRSRPRSPHLFTGPMQFHYRFSPAMLTSITHRATGAVMATVGAILLVWFLAAIAAGESAYATFRDVFTTSSGHLNIVGYVVGIGLTWSVFQHMASGIRHLVMDTGAAFELKTNQLFARLTFVFSIVMTILFWLWLGLK
ncbi:succinate dehydrogenase, cytochrome b556 subunit [uncultured Sphingomonas sp.]|uniref:succinate dehydrogenase, cytochrome b556 subunit n=1 Tax=uncultured Sphingomonas sp. TaxID=158754 RepID=UPI0025FB9FAC|nr:succinate dehydrogenase, cytochrome b556 subunit [uncultured Sphingomonas sp.]